MKKILVIMVILSMVVFGTCLAAKYPEKTIKYVVPFAPGSGVDFSVKAQMKYLEAALGQKVEVAYNPGNGGADALSDIAKGTPDGYTIIACSLPQVIIQPMQKDYGYKTEDLNFVYIFCSVPNVLVVDKDSPMNSLSDFVKAAKANPADVTVSGSTIGSGSHLGTVVLGKAIGVKLSYVPNAMGYSVALASLKTNKIKAIMASPDFVIANAKDLKVLAVEDGKRLSVLPNVPTCKEQGYNVINGGYRGVAVSPKTSPEIMKTLEVAFDKVNKNPEFKAEMAKLGVKIEDMGIDASKKFMADQTKYYQGIRADLGL